MIKSTQTAIIITTTLEVGRVYDEDVVEEYLNIPFDVIRQNNQLEGIVILHGRMTSWHYHKEKGWSKIGKRGWEKCEEPTYEKLYQKEINRPYLLLVYNPKLADNTIEYTFDGVTIKGGYLTNSYESLWNYACYPAPLIFQRKTFSISNMNELQRCRDLFKEKGYKVYTATADGGYFG